VTRRIVVTGTDTGIGKTVFSAALVGALDGYYWKPVQSGLEDETDSDTVRRLSGLAAERILPEAYRLKTPVSPHLAAESTVWPSIRQALCCRRPRARWSSRAPADCWCR